MIFAVVRTRATDGVNYRIIDTLKMMHLTRPNHATLVPDTPQYRGMLQKSKDWITWGEVDEEVLARLLAARGRLVGDKRLTDAYVKQSTGHPSVRELARELATGKMKLKDVPGLKPLFRLNPPKGGYGGNKRGWNDGGGLGYRGKDINKLLGACLAFENTAAQGAKPGPHHAEAAGTHHVAKPGTTTEKRPAAAPPAGKVT